MSARPHSKRANEAERTVVFSMLGRAGRHTSRRGRDSVYRDSGQSREDIDRAITRFAQAGVLVATQRTIKATSTLVTLDELGLIGI